MYFSHDPVFDALLRKIESLTQKFGKTESPHFCGVQLLIIGHFEIRNRASANRAKHAKSVSTVKFTISVFSQPCTYLYSVVCACTVRVRVRVQYVYVYSTNC